MFSLFGPEIKSCNSLSESATARDGSPRGCLVPTMNDYLEHRDSKIQESKTIASPCEPDYLDLRESKKLGFDFALPSEKRQQYDTLAYQAINAPQSDKQNEQISSAADKLPGSIKDALGSDYTIAMSAAGEVWLGRKIQSNDNGRDPIYVLAEKIKDAQCPEK